MEKGYLAIEDAVDAALISNGTVVSTNCELCGKQFFALKEKLYKENIVDRDRIDITKFEFVTTVKCPHCGYCGKLIGGINNV